MNTYKIKTKEVVYRAVGVAIDKDCNKVSDIDLVANSKAEAKALAKNMAESYGARPVIKVVQVASKITKVLETNLSLEEIAAQIGGNLRNPEKGERI